MNKLYYEEGHNTFVNWKQYYYPILKAPKRGPDYVIYFAYDVEEAVWNIYVGDDDLEHSYEAEFDDIKNKYAKSDLIEKIFSDETKEVIQKWK